MEKTIYDLELHEQIRLGSSLVFITRVPGGWIYDTPAFESANGGVHHNSTFIPFHNEFQSTVDYDPNIRGPITTL